MGEGRPRILVVEDEPVIAALVEDVLAAEGYEVDLAGSVGAALDWLRDRRYDLCLTDFLLPDRTGLDLARELARGARHTFPMLLVTAYLEPEFQRQVDEIPRIVGVIRKPMDIFELRDAVRRLVAKSAAESA